MPDFNEYLRLAQAMNGTKPAELARAIRQDRSLEEWHRKTLLFQLGLSQEGHRLAASDSPWDDAA